MLGDIVERASEAPVPPSAPRAPGASTAGFPTILHRSLKPKRPSTFNTASSRQTKANETFIGRPVEAEDVPRLSPADNPGPSRGSESTVAGPSAIIGAPGENEYARVQRETGSENSRRVAMMSSVEREGEIRDLEERFGSSVLDALRMRAQKRAESAATGKEKPDSQAATLGPESAEVAPTQGAPPTQAGMSMSTTTAAAIPAASDKTVRFDASAASPPSPADLKSTYFTNTPIEPKKLAWLSDAIPSASSPADNIRFDLSGRLLSSAEQTDLPVHLGLHHHGDQPDLAGYTITEILHLCRSTVPAQRVGMMGLLSKIIALYSLRESPDGEVVRQLCAKLAVCDRAVSLGVDALINTRNVSLLQVSIELLYTALGGPTWTFSPAGIAFRPEADAGGRTAPVSSVPFEDLLHRLSELLTTPDYLPSITITHLLRILRRAAASSSELAQTILPLLSPIMQTHVIRVPWPIHSGSTPLLEPIHLMADLIASSRTCAAVIVDAGLPPSLLRFCVVSTWEKDDTLGLELSVATLRVYVRLARYGLASGTARTGHDVWTRLGHHVSSCLDMGGQLLDLAEAYLRLLEGWITCAVDPHRTTPEHDLTWTQVAGLGWVEEAMQVIDSLTAGEAGAEDSNGVLNAAMDVLVAWVVGLGVNEVKGGQDQKEELQRWIGRTGLSRVIKNHLDKAKGGKAEGGLLLGALRLQAALATQGGVDSGRLIVGPADLATLVSTERGHLIRYELIRHSLAIDSDTSAPSLSLGFDLITQLQPGEEALALDLLDILLKHDWATASPKLAADIRAIKNPDSLTLLRPLLQHAILPDVTNITAPSHIHHLYLKATGSLRPPAPSSRSTETGRAPPGLPLRRDWFFHPIDELLHSADSVALQQSPIDWQPTEMEIVRASLVLLRLALGGGYSLNRSAILFGLMKVYMLEHQTGGMINTGESEIFRDDAVKASLGAFLGNMTLHPADREIVFPSSVNPAGLETAAIPFLGLEPFYQFYTDLVSLFENASFGDATFAQIILPPLSMGYPPDYRKIVWSNPNVLRLLRTQTEDVPLEQAEEGLGGFFEPPEQDPEVLSAYGQAVVRGWVGPRQGFLWSVAIYHLRAFFGEADGVGAGEESKAEREKQLALSRLRKGLREAVMGSRNAVVVEALQNQGDGKPWKL